MIFSKKILTTIFMIISTICFSQDFVEKKIKDGNKWGKPKTIDFNKDGFIDLVSASTDGTIAWWLNDGLMNFTKKIIYKNHSYWQDFDLGDLDGDGDIDIIVLDTYNIYIFYNDGNLNFSQEKKWSNYLSTNTIIADFNGDGKDDFITTERSSNGRLRFWKNEGNNTFVFTTIDNSFSIYNGNILSNDIDKDGDLDLIVSDRFTTPEEESLFIYVNDGNGNFTKKPINFKHLVGNNLSQILDYNKDGHLDILIKDGLDDFVSILINNGNLEFTETKLINKLNTLKDVVAIDINNNGSFDLAVVSSKKTTIYLNDGSENFSPTEINPIIRGKSIISQDFNNDNLPELIVTAEITNHPIFFQNLGSTKFKKNSLDTTFALSFIKVADINNNGFKDIIAVSKEGTELIFFKNLGGYNFEEILIDSINLNIQDIDIGDINGDGLLDIITGSKIFSPTSAKGVFLYTNNGDLTFTKKLLIHYDSPKVLTSDIDNDGDIDIVYNAGRPRYLKNDGTGNFNVVIIHEEANNPKVTRVLDIDNDGDKDFLTNTTLYYENNGEIPFIEKTLLNIPLPTNVGGFVDLDQDGDFDIIRFSRSEKSYYFSWYENNGLGLFTEHVIDNSYSGGSILCNDFDGDGDKDIFTTASTDWYGSEGLILWKNNGNQTFEKNIIENEFYIAGYSLYSIDADNDGDIDVISSNYKYPLTIWENKSDVPLSVDNFLFTNKKIILFPNPSSDFIQIKNNINIKTIEIYNFLGKKLSTHTNTKKINIEHLPQGIYFAKVVTKNNGIEIVKIMKE